MSRLRVCVGRRLGGSICRALVEVRLERERVNEAGCAARVYEEKVDGVTCALLPKRAKSCD